MRKLIFFKLGCCVMVGLLVPLSAVQASDDANDRIQASLGEGSMQVGKYESWSPPKGAQGPIRSDMTEGKATDSGMLATNQDASSEMFPHPDRGYIPTVSYQ